MTFETFQSKSWQRNYPLILFFYIKKCQPSLIVIAKKSKLKQNLSSVGQKWCCFDSTFLANLESISDGLFWNLFVTLMNVKKSLYQVGLGPIKI